MVVYEDTYMTLQEANELISKMYISTSKERVFWESLSDADKETLISSFTLSIDNESMLYRGRKAEPSQDMQFPRIIDGHYTDVPYSIKQGILSQMLRNNLLKNSDFSELRENGVKSFADGGGGKIEFADISNVNKNNLDNSIGINNKIWNSYFADWSLLCEV